jgi:holo-[acyl-carrier protein] synthase
VILGIGSDLLDCRRIQKVVERQGQRFLNRVFTPDEQERCHRRYHAFQSYGKIYAAKEAVLKAIGNVQGIHWQHIEIKHAANGRPFVILTEQARVNYEALIPTPMSGRIDLTLTDEPPYAQAFVVISAVHRS